MRELLSDGREFRSPQVLPRGNTSTKRPKVCPPKFYAVPHNRLVQEGETVRFQCAVVGHPTPWVRWDKNGSIVTPSARISIKERDDVKILEIVDVMREDAALYRVTAENDFGRIEASARLEVISTYIYLAKKKNTSLPIYILHKSFSSCNIKFSNRQKVDMTRQVGLSGLEAPHLGLILHSIGASCQLLVE